MKKAILTLLCYPACLLSIAQEKYTFKANIHGLGNDTVYCIAIPLNASVSGSDADQRMDTFLARNSTFTYTLHVQGPAIVTVIPRTTFYKKPRGGLYLPMARAMELILEPTDHLAIHGVLDSDYLAYAVSGSAINDTLATWRAGYKDLARKIEKLDEAEFQTMDTTEARRLWMESSAAKAEITRQKLALIARNLDNPLSAYYLLQSPIDFFGACYPKLSPEVREGIFRNRLDARYKQYQDFTASTEAKEKLQVGTAAPALSLKAIDGTTFSLADRPKNRYIVLDFWGSWCVPCMADMPKLKEYQAKYKGSITFIGIACNDDEVHWRKAVMREEFDWLQLIDDKEKQVSVLYGVQAYPTKVILDKDLRIVGRFIGRDQGFYKMLDDLGGK